MRSNEASEVDVGEPATGGALLRLSASTSDAELIERIAEGDRWAQEAFYRRYVDLVGATALRLLRHRAEAEDVVQETFLIAFQRLGQLRDSAAVKTWLVRIAVSRSRRRYRWHTLRRMFGAGMETDEALDQAAAEGASAEDRAELALIDHALQRLREPLRTTWLLRHALGLSLAETAEATDCSLSAVKRRLTLAQEHVDRHVREGGVHG